MTISALAALQTLRHYDRPPVGRSTNVTPFGFFFFAIGHFSPVVNFAVVPVARVVAPRSTRDKSSSFCGGRAASLMAAPVTVDIVPATSDTSCHCARRLIATSPAYQRLMPAPVTCNRSPLPKTQANQRA